MNFCNRPPCGQESIIHDAPIHPLGSKRGRKDTKNEYDHSYTYYHAGGQQLRYLNVNEINTGCRWFKNELNQSDTHGCNYIWNELKNIQILVIWSINYWNAQNGNRKQHCFVNVSKQKCQNVTSLHNTNLGFRNPLWTWPREAQHNKVPAEFATESNTIETVAQGEVLLTLQSQK